jgi:regulator of protease activity HflC (stomatin/prohibitin superfamily)
LESGYIYTTMIEYLFGLIFVVLVVVIVWIILNSFIIIHPYERGVVERLGSYHRTLDPGLNFVILEVERVRKVDVREQVLDIPPQEVITKDNASIMIDLVVYTQVIDPYRVLYNVSNFEDASVNLAQTNIRNIVGGMGLDEILGARERINLELRQILDDATDKWGVRVTRVEIQEITPPGDILDAMARQMKAERIKRAAILEAEGIKESTVLKAEGEKNAAILTAEGKAEAMKTVANAEKYAKIATAEGESQAIIEVFNAIHRGKPTKEILTLKYLEALSSISNGSANKVFLPLETMGMLSSVSALGEVFRDYRSGPKPKEERSEDNTGDTMMQ